MICTWCEQIIFALAPSLSYLSLYFSLYLYWRPIWHASRACDVRNATFPRLWHLNFRTHNHFKRSILHVYLSIPINTHANCLSCIQIDLLWSWTVINSLLIVDSAYNLFAWTNNSPCFLRRYLTKIIYAAADVNIGVVMLH